MTEECYRAILLWGGGGGGGLFLRADILLVLF